MNSTRFVRLAVALAMSGALYFTAILCAQSPSSESGAATAKSSAKSTPKKDEIKRVSLEVAKDRAKLMHDIYASTLDVMHHRYFHGDRSMVPARAMEDVFAEIKQKSHAEARWISVNLKAMSIDHEPDTEFEKQAAREISAGKTEFDVVEPDYYRRAGAIRLTSGCVSCHAGLFNANTTTPKFAALVISVPITSGANNVGAVTPVSATPETVGTK